MDITKVTVIGAGDMGHGIAESALIAGFDVCLYDVKGEFVERGVQNIDKSLSKFLSKDIITKEQYDRIMGQALKTSTELSESVQSADLVIEAIPEDLSLKIGVFEELDKHSPEHTLLASNTSSIPITKIGQATARPEKVLGLHYFNPAVLMKLVEVIKGESTSEETMDAGYDFVLKNNKVPVRVRKDIPGFIVNRVQAPGTVLLNCILDEQSAEPEEIDALFRKQGHPMGPIELIDYTGVDINCQYLKYLEKLVHPDYASGRVVSEMVERGELGKKTGKGFFTWHNGQRPEIDLNKTTDTFDPADFAAVNINEAARLIEMGVCSADDIDKAIIHATGSQKGLIEIGKEMGAEDLIGRLNRLSERFGKDIFKPAETIQKIITGKGQ